MPTGQPSNAPTDAAPSPREETSVASVMNDDRMDDAPGGGGLMGAGAGGPLSGDALGQAGAATPNAPIDAELPHDSGDAGASDEARTLAANAGPAEPHPGSA